MRHLFIALAAGIAAFRVGRTIERGRLKGVLSAADERLAALSRRLVDVQEAERRNVALELHDEVGQLLIGLHLMVEGAGPRRQEEIVSAVRHLVARVRDLATTLRPPMLDELGLLATLVWLIERFESQTAIAVDFKHSNLDRRFPGALEITVFRIVQEALTNVARHAAARQARVRVWADRDWLEATVEDSGRGFESGRASAGRTVGLAGMSERARLLGGQLVIQSAPAGGTRVSVRLPRPPISSGAE